MAEHLFKPGDLVFFEPDDTLISQLVALLDSPGSPLMPASHCAVVVRSNSNQVEVIHNTLHGVDPAGQHVTGVQRSSLASVCNGRRSMLIVRRGDSPNDDLTNEAEALIKDSDYSKPLLVLAGVASLYRRIPCTDPPNPHWETVHFYARAIVDSAQQNGSHVGTCVGTLAEIEANAGLGMGICEPECSERANARPWATHVVELVDTLGKVADELAEELGVIDRVEAFVSAAWNELKSVVAGAGAPPTGAGRPRKFGRRAAIWLLCQLRDFDMLDPDDADDLIRGLLKTFGLLDILDAPDDGVAAPEPGTAVYGPLMSLGLMCSQLVVKGPYKPYTDPP